MKKKFAKFLAFVGLISIFCAVVPRHDGTVTSTEGAAPSATFVLDNNNSKLLDFIISPQEQQFFEFVSQASVSPCVEYGALEEGWGPLRQDWFNHLDAPAYARFTMACVHGWDGNQYDCLNTLWGERESGWNPTAKNKSGAYGIPQALPGYKMGTVGLDWQFNPRTQVKWGLNYIRGVYGSPCNALAHSYRKGWY